MNENSTFREIVDGVLANLRITDKHNPNAVNYQPRPGDPFRSIFTPMASSSMEPFVKSEAYQINLYRKPNGEFFSRFIPDDPASIPAIVASASGSAAQPGEVLDAYIFASGSLQGYHPFAGSSADIDKRVREGKLTLVGTLRPSTS